MLSFGELGAMIDPVALSRQAGIEPDPWQSRLLRSESPRLLVNCSRQSGKSTTVATRVLWEAITFDNHMTLIVCPGQRQSGEIFRKMLAVYRATGRRVPAQSETKLTLELWNGSRIVALPGLEETIRGFSAVDTLVLDEAARVSDELYAAVRPMLAVSKGRILAPTTPYGQRGWFYEAWHNNVGNEWDKVFITADECPRIEPEFIASERANFGDDWIAQEYYGKFLKTARSPFHEEDIGAVFEEEVEAWTL